MKNKNRILIFVVVLITINSAILNKPSLSLLNCYGDSCAVDFLEEFSVNCVNINNSKKFQDNVSVDLAKRWLNVIEVF